MTQVVPTANLGAQRFVLRIVVTSGYFQSVRFDIRMVQKQFGETVKCLTDYLPIDQLSLNSRFLIGDALL